MKKQKFNYWQITTYILYVIVIIFALLAISAKFSLFGVKMLVDKSGSMAPAIKTGSLVIDKTFNHYSVGDIVTFPDSNNPGETITHRLVNQEVKGNILVFTTQGDANGVPDSTKITEGDILGKVVFNIPYLGYAVAFTRTVPGLIILIVIPATIIIYDEVNKIKEEMKKRKTNIRKKEA